MKSAVRQQEKKVGEQPDQNPTTPDDITDGSSPVHLPFVTCKTNNKILSCKPKNLSSQQTVVLFLLREKGRVFTLPEGFLQESRDRYYSSP